MTELQILNAIKNNGGHMDYVSLMNLGKADTIWSPNADKQRIRQLINAQILTGDIEAQGTIRFGDVGYLRLQDLQQIEEKNAQQAAKEENEKKSQHRHEWAIAIFSTLGGALLSDPLWNLLRLIFQ